MASLTLYKSPVLINKHLPDAQEIHKKQYINLLVFGGVLHKEK